MAPARKAVGFLTPTETRSTANHIAQDHQKKKCK